MEIHFEERDGRGRWYGTPEGSEEEAEMSFSRSNATLILVDHTFVPPPVRGQGLAAALAKAAVAHARREGWKIVPVCPFLKAEAQRHRDWADVIED
ncbi:GNAT family N-acetyltransferase [Sphingomicrobium astaxanthinifaciens]|uniref:GNAT family N-acetyltransferase n=1 Tax=Sphingomicrobium astaxanthinifaciens TaxID=1227949 RepID=UPI001FCAF87D|nr:GNAT family N-acetyltransferase [Sphingomicrobium astaxanthinifaciens]MCJ7420483.1 GNAT family N-acetyltransferase [Sphingomicrobium astaxanthinifaciens]